MKHQKAVFFIACLLLLSLTVLNGQELDWDSYRGTEEFRFGVQAYHNGLFDNALLSFERALGFSSDDAVSKEWLGRTYHRLGSDASALALWREVVDAGYGTALLQQRIDVISAQRSLEREKASAGRYILGETLEGVLPDYTLFSRPTGIEAWSDGSYYLASFAQNEVYQFNLNGALQRTLQGGVLGFDKPFDVLAYNSERLFVSEFGSDRISSCSPDGTALKRFGSSGGGAGELSGPQYLARDGAGYIYVTEAGNRRVSKFSPDGDFILSFGKRGDGFSGLSAPSGIAVVGDAVFVADVRRQAIFCFDLSGNFLYQTGNDLLIRPEGISVLGAERLLVSDEERLMVYHIPSRSYELLADFNGEHRRIVDAVRDVNGNILMSDFNRNEIGVLSELSAMYSGVFVEIERIDSESFPEVFMDVSVRDRLGAPIVGLRESNFILSEGHGMPGSPALLAQGDSIDGIELAVIIERSPYTYNEQEEIAAGVGEIFKALPAGSRMRLYSAADVSTLEVPAGSTLNDYLKAAARPGGDSSDFAMPETIRQAALELAPQRGRKMIVSIGSGNMPPESNSVTRPSTATLGSLLATNGIRYLSIQLGRSLTETPYSESFRYLTAESGGGMYALRRAAGISPVIKDFGTRPTGRYYLKLVSQRDPDYGKRYLPVEVEVSYYNRTGRDELGYYAAPPYN